jgi:hypothetical protein
MYMLISLSLVVLYVSTILQLSHVVAMGTDQTVVCGALVEAALSLAASTRTNLAADLGTTKNMAMLHGRPSPARNRGPSEIRSGSEDRATLSASYIACYKSGVRTNDVSWYSFDTLTALEMIHHKGAKVFKGDEFVSVERTKIN